MSDEWKARTKPIDDALAAERAGAPPPPCPTCQTPVRVHRTPVSVWVLCETPGCTSAHFRVAP